MNYSEIKDYLKHDFPHHATIASLALTEAGVVAFVIWSILGNQ